MDKFFELKTPKEALSLLFSNWETPETPKETIPLGACYGRTLGEDIFSPEDLPPFDRSTVDGYAVDAKDTFGASPSLPAILNLAPKIKMGEIPKWSIGQGEASQVPTGGALPEGANACAMVEHTNALDDFTVLLEKSVSPWENIVKKGEDIGKGSLLLKQGTFLGPYEIGALAALGICRVPVFSKPKVAILSSGDEIIPPFKKPRPGEIRDINSYSLAAATLRAGGDPLILGIAEDAESALKEKVDEGLLKADILLLSGGSSVGAKDLTAKIFEDLGPPGVLVHGVSISPGKPLIISCFGQKLLFGLPGHPASALTTFELFVRPAIEKVLSYPSDKSDLFRPVLTANLSGNISSAPGRQDHVKVRLFEENGVLWAEPVLGKSSLITTMVKADGEIVIKPQLEGLMKGTNVQVSLYRLRD